MEKCIICGASLRILSRILKRKFCKNCGGAKPQCQRCNAQLKTADIEVYMKNAFYESYDYEVKRGLVVPLLCRSCRDKWLVESDMKPWSHQDLEALLRSLPFLSKSSNLCENRESEYGIRHLGIYSCSEAAKKLWDLLDDPYPYDITENDPKGTVKYHGHFIRRYLTDDSGNPIQSICLGLVEGRSSHDSWHIYALKQHEGTVLLIKQRHFLGSVD